ncbi:fumarate reductase/succinate dehydrogenase flavoprotein subunit [Streptacidiphilus carbonis]|uniref:fumarate reductase/succinate dehydrogenase flavoprotein subunit n=1 Tax=Streptacidiphilus carbonis TaxID=105422 RepID=UPI0005A7EDED|nr:fumarate reductase/succinate dehydrogenase flavoprotein subunit [Streptacidiphilus carbonis]
MAVPALADAAELSCDVLVIGGGTAGTMAALTAAEHGAQVLLLEKAHVRHSGALAMGMDGVNNAVVPGRATPEDYIAEITRANDGVVNQRTVRQTAELGFAMVQRLERYGVKFEKDEHGEYAVRQVHRSGSYVLPMPEGKDVKKVLYRVLRQRHMRERITIENRVMPVRVLTDPESGRAVGAAGFHTRTGQFTVVRAGAVILATGAAGRLGLPASGYLYGTYENPTNAGDGHSMAYHAGAELSGIECFQVNPLIKDYNGPACAYVANPFGGYQVNREGERFVDSDYWSGQMMAEFAAEVDSARGPVYLKLSHLPEESVAALEGILHSTERPTRGTFHAGRGHDYRTHDVEMHISEIGLCGGHSASGVWVDEHARTTVPGLYAAGDLACVPHNYMIGAFVYGDLAGADAARTAAARAADPDRPARSAELSQEQLRAAHELVYRPLLNPEGPPQPQVEYKLRRFVNDYVAPPKTGARLSLALEHFERMRGEIAAMGATTPHELMRCAEVGFIRDCAEMAARSSLAREESRWGLYHQRLDVPERDDKDWLRHLNLRKRSGDGAMEFLLRPVSPYLVPVEGFEPDPGLPVELIGEVHGEQVAVAGSIGAAPRPFTPVAQPTAAAGPAAAAGPRLLELLGLAESQPDLDRLRRYLADPDPAVRRTAVSVLTESVPEGTGPELARALADPDAEVRGTAAAGLRELVEVLAAEPGSPSPLEAPLLAALASADPVVRATALDLLRALRLGSAAVFAAGLDDPEASVRVQAVRALVSLDAVDVLRAAVGDPVREVRIALAQGLGRISRPRLAETAAELVRLSGDDDPLVRAAALEAAGSMPGGSSPALSSAALAAVGDAAWQVRKGAAAAMARVEGDAGSAALLGLLADAHPDVRKAAVIAAVPRAGRQPALAAALADAAVQDPDADVRAFARRVLS